MIPHRPIEALVAPTGSSRPDIAWPTPPEWMARAACTTEDPELFFAEKGGSTRAAVRVCEACPVAAPCLAWALEHFECHGVYGGTTPRERRRLRGDAA